MVKLFFFSLCFNIVFSLHITFLNNRNKPLKILCISVNLRFIALRPLSFSYSFFFRFSFSCLASPKIVEHIVVSIPS